MLTPEQLEFLRLKRGNTAGRKPSKFTDNEITLMRSEFWIEKCTATTIAKKWGISKTAISSIVNGKTYKEVPFPSDWFVDYSKLGPLK